MSGFVQLRYWAPAAPGDSASVSYGVRDEGTLGGAAGGMRVSMHAHVDGRSFLAAALEEVARVVQRALDELVGVGEVDRLDRQSCTAV